MDNNKSRLVKPVRGWSEDLPDPEEEQRVFPRLIRVNEINDVWMEIPRYVNHGWGGVWFAGFVGLAIQGERVEMAGHADWGHRIYCAVCRPGTYQVVDRFILTWTVGNVQEVYGLWSACCQYMQGKAVSDKPLLTHVPPDWTPFKTVRWPPEMDKVSKAVPEWA